MTDALAQWFLLGMEQARDPLGQVNALLAQPSAQSAFAAWVEERRRNSSLRNDDVTLSVVDMM